MAPGKRLVYDIGLHDGSDTAYYLQRGFRVVAVEANPELAASAEQRFADAIANGDLSVLNVAIGESEGEATFWVSEHTEWSSFDRAIAARQGSGHEAINIRVTPLAKIVEQHGLPWLCKVDIEGADRFCLDAFSPDARPELMSVELSGEWDVVGRLAALGYTRFRLFDQLRLCNANRLVYAALRAVPASMRKRAEGANRQLRSRLREGEWEFKIGSSGPAPDTAPGRWLSEDRAKRRARALTEGGGKLGEWWDVHACG
jgi:FkbM family methyltransferase